jgi:hypothetical protein
MVRSSVRGEAFVECSVRGEAFVECFVRQCEQVVGTVLEFEEKRGMLCPPCVVVFTTEKKSKSLGLFYSSGRSVECFVRLV